MLRTALFMILVIIKINILVGKIIQHRHTIALAFSRQLLTKHSPRDFQWDGDTGVHFSFHLSVADLLLMLETQLSPFQDE